MERSTNDISDESNRIDKRQKEKSKAEEKFKLKLDKKLNKKVAKAIGIILHHENKKPEEIFSETPSKNLWCYHFGNGDEEDQMKIKKYFEENYGSGIKVIIYPGISYGFIELNSLEVAENIVKNQKVLNIVEEKENLEGLKTEEMNNIKNENLKKYLIKKNEDNNYIEQENGLQKQDRSKKGNPHSQTKIKTFYHNINFDNGGDRTVFTIFSKITNEYVLQNSICNFPNAQYKVEVPGLFLFDDFVSVEQESSLIENLDKNKWEKLTNRRVQHYGYEFIYGANIINKNNKIGEMPPFCCNLMKKFEDLLKKFLLKKNNDINIENKKYDIESIKEYFDYHYDENNENKEKYDTFFSKHGNFDQLTINDYTPGEGIPPHWDSHSPFEDIFCALSLNSGIVMSFFLNGITKHLYIKPRSLIIFSGEARFLWEHSIALRKIDRVEDNIYFRKRRLSLTFRKIRKSECDCPYTLFCDSQKKKLGKVSPLSDFNLNLTDGNDNIAKKTKTTDPIAIDKAKTLLNSDSSLPTDIEKIHVYDVYEKIAPHFSHTRYKPWPKVAQFLESLPLGSLNADIGCGNGKYLNVNDKDLYNIGTDRCFNLISICREKNHNNQVFAADSLMLPFRSNCFDSAISIAVVHHFSNKTLRLRAISEIIRILQIGGKFLIYVWALEQEKNFEQQDNFVPWHLQNNYENELQVQTLGPQIIKEEKKNSTVYHRYYHMFKKDELEELLKNFDNIEILESYYDHANWCCIVRKIK